MVVNIGIAKMFDHSDLHKHISVFSPEAWSNFPACRRACLHLKIAWALV